VCVTSALTNLLCAPENDDLTRLSGKDGILNSAECMVTYKGGKGNLWYGNEAGDTPNSNYSPADGSSYTIDATLIFDYACDEEDRKCDAGLRFKYLDEDTFYQLSFRKLKVGENDALKNRLVLKYGSTLLLTSSDVYFVTTGVEYYVRVIVGTDNIVQIYVRGQFDDPDDWQNVFGDIDCSSIATGSIGVTGSNAYVRFKAISLDVDVVEPSCPQPLIQWSFNDLSADYSTDSTYAGFDLDLYNNGGYSSDTFNSASGAPYLDGAGNLICVSGTNDFALSHEQIPFDVTDKTYVVIGNTLDLDSRAGALMSMDWDYSGSGTSWSYGSITQTTHAFDSLNYGERVPKEWVMQTEFSLRNADFNGPLEDSTESKLFIMTFSNNEVSLYRDCEQYGSTATSTTRTFAADETRFMFCTRHFQTTGTPFRIEYAAFYDRALSSEEIDQLCTCADGLDEPAPEIPEAESKSVKNNALFGELSELSEFDYKVYGAACLIVLFGIFGIIRLVKYCKSNGYKQIDDVNIAANYNDYQTVNI